MKDLRKAGEQYGSLPDDVHGTNSCMHEVGHAVFGARQQPVSLQVKQSYALLKEGLGRGQGAEPGSAAAHLHDALWKGAEENLHYQLARPVSRTSVDAKAKMHNALSPRFILDYTLSMSSGALGASAFCMSPSWTRTTQLFSGGRFGFKVGSHIRQAENRAQPEAREMGRDPDHQLVESTVLGGSVAPGSA